MDVTEALLRLWFCNGHRNLQQAWRKPVNTAIYLRVNPENGR